MLGLKTARAKRIAGSFGGDGPRFLSGPGECLKRQAAGEKINFLSDGYADFRSQKVSSKHTEKYLCGFRLRSEPQGGNR